MNRVFLLAGSNIGDRKANMKEALQLLEKYAGRIVRKSELYLTQPWGFHADNDFLNQAILIETSLSPVDLLDQLKNIENEMGRLKRSAVYESRIIDLDILFYNDQIIEEGEKLIVPHPRIQDRKFALIPMKEIAIDYIHPKLRQSINNLTAVCKDNCSVGLLKDVQ